MTEESSKINPALRLPHWWIGDPFVVLESILNQVEGEQAKQITALYLDSVTATLEANLKFVRGADSGRGRGSQKVRPTGSAAGRRIVESPFLLVKVSLLEGLVS
jgi:hypothetical protein